MNDFEEIIEECIAQKDFYNADRMKQVYLEYRRANNIFEVGDKVVCKNENIDLCDGIVLEIEHFRVDLIALGYFFRLNNGNDFKSENLRHATDEEIAAGHRL